MFFTFGIASSLMPANCRNSGIIKISVNLKNYCESVLGSFLKNGEAPVEWGNDSSLEHFDPFILFQELSSSNNVVDEVSKLF